ncbi:follicular epithelium yolk protein subunit [Fluviispira sanaruensis]|uniref:Follicular epithelium yolk protein subunit n=1 Tax=Fluviispira sanaruensis TaxID=2493639 RepID=A0A4P2W047_FLUSA|nr:follicular epithelium yolk protein subunit [Fluviispira sanaruensis]BBH54522.1 follicular epithelium yolk protein subunit [Fluviispira sanaruensis]
MTISVNIKAGNTIADSKVNVEGFEKYVITSAERNSFGFGTDSLLKEAIGKLMGKNPDYAYLTKNQTELYNKYNWSEVTVILNAKSTEILELSSKPSIIKTQTFRNNSSVTAVCNASISSQITNTVTSTWSSSNSVSFNEKVKCKATFLGLGIEEETTFGYSYNWGQGGSNSQTETIGSTSGFSVTLNPGVSVQANLISSKGTMKIRIVYTATLIGETVFDYSNTYNGHHYYASSINDVIERAGSPRSVDITEEIDIDYYSNSQIDIIDAEGKITNSFFSNKPSICSEFVSEPINNA